ncbi:hypothetical protein BDZ89DRAFT_680169 [Hymenopellis radicata]|nr:hypothetical protein BDZ89DRAFT_680169 [Hymenopellis radicata]
MAEITGSAVALQLAFLPPPPRRRRCRCPRMCFDAATHDYAIADRTLRSPILDCLPVDYGFVIVVLLTVVLSFVLRDIASETFKASPLDGAGSRYAFLHSQVLVHVDGSLLLCLSSIDCRVTNTLSWILFPACNTLLITDFLHLQRHPASRVLELMPARITPLSRLECGDATVSFGWRPLSSTRYTWRIPNTTGFSQAESGCA